LERQDTKNNLINYSRKMVIFCPLTVKSLLEEMSIPRSPIYIPYRAGFLSVFGLAVVL